MPRAFQFAVIGAALIFAGSGDAFGKIRCEGRWQIVNGGRISTPYCEDTYLAEVGRSHGAKVSAQSIRQNPFAKESLCHLVGRDIRVKDICSGYLSEDFLP